MLRMDSGWKLEGIDRSFWYVWKRFFGEEEVLLAIGSHFDLNLLESRKLHQIMYNFTNYYFYWLLS